MPPRKTINHPGVLTQHHPAAADSLLHTNPEDTHPTSTTSHSTPVLRRANPPTTHDPTKRPPWKKHKFHSKPPTSDWAVLWPRPPSYYCPPGASRLTDWGGCHYIDPPGVFDPEIEGLPDWIGSDGKTEGRLWSGVDRVVEVPGEKRIKVVEDEWKGLERRGVDGEDETKQWVEEEGVTWDGEWEMEEHEGGKGEKLEGVARIINKVSHIPSWFERTSGSGLTLISTPTPMLPMTTSSLAPAPTSEILPTVTATEEVQGVKEHPSVKPAIAIIHITVSAIGVLIFCMYMVRLQWKKFVQRNNEKLEELRRRAEEVGAEECGHQPNEKNLEESRGETTDETNE